MKAIQVMRQPVFAATRTASAQDIAAQLVVNSISGMPVAESDGTVVGVVSEADILRALVEGKRLETLTAQEIMNAHPITVDVETPLAEVMKTVHEYGILRVPVTDQGHLVGIISRGDVIRAAVESFQTQPFIIFS
jgi:CBS domain-containing protein